MKEIVRIENLTVIYNENNPLYACRDINVSLAEGEVLCILGESGSGKTTLGLSITKLLAPEAKIISGRIIFEDRNILEMEEEQLFSIRGNKISYVFQEPYSFLDPLMKVGRQIGEVLEVHKNIKPHLVKSTVLEFLSNLGFDEPLRVYNSFPHQLSGGMNQRVMIGMALISCPRILVCDEPTSSLDFFAALKIMDFIMRLRRELKFSVFFITHDLYLARRYSQRVAFMLNSKIVELCPTQDFFSQPLHPYCRYIVSLFKEFEKAKISKVYSGPAEGSYACAFYPRCPSRKRECLNFTGGLREVEPGHFVDCPIF